MSSNHHWASTREAGAVSGMQFLFSVYRHLGRLPFRICLFPVMLYFLLFRGSARRSSLQYLSYLQDAGLMPRSRCRICQSYKHFYDFGECLLDKLAVWQGDIDLDDVTFHNYEVFGKLAESGQGAVIIGSHLGNLEISRALAHRRRSLKMNVLMHTVHTEKFNRILQQAGTDSQVNIIPVSEINPATAILLQQKISAGEFLVITGDRIPISSSAHTSPVQFLGHQCRLPNGAYILAAILKCPVLVMFCLRRQHSAKPHYDLYMEHFAERIELPRGNRTTALQRHSQAYADLLARYCAKQPLQWYNFHSFWNGGDSDMLQSGRIR